MTTERAHDDATRAVLLGVGLLLLAVILWTLRDIVVLIAFAVLIAYALDPLVVGVERVPLPGRRHIPRRIAAAIVMLSLVALAVWLLSLVLPRLFVELEGFIRSVPQGVETLLSETRGYAARHGLASFIDPVLLNARTSTTAIMQWLGGESARWVARLFSGIAQVLGLAVLPILTFYLLAERKAVQESLLDFIPEGAHGYVAAARRALSQGLRSYVRGQGLVCLIMGASTGTALAAIGYPVALLLGVIVGIAEVMPYLGFILAALSIGIAGSTQGLTRALIGVGIYTLVNQLNGLFVTPRVMGRHLKMHPFVVMVSVLAGGELLGPAGALLALPGAAIAQALIGELAPRRGRHSKRPAKEAEKKPA